MSKLLAKYQGADEAGCTHKVTPASANWDYVGFECFELEANQSLTMNSGDTEVCLVLVGGKASISTASNNWQNIGERSGPFDRTPPYAVYLPPNTEYKVEAGSELELAVTRAPAQGIFEERLITPSELSYVQRGQGTNERWVCNILFGEGDAESLLVVEVITPDGNWSSYPPHKHDSDDGDKESQLEETYYHRVDPPQGFAFQRVYTDDRSLDETMCVENKDLVMVPYGYHPVGAAHGYQLYYLNVMAGPDRRWVFKNDPQHEWMLE